MICLECIDSVGLLCQITFSSYDCTRIFPLNRAPPSLDQFQSISQIHHWAKNTDSLILKGNQDFILMYILHKCLEKKMKRFKYFTSWIFLLILVSAAAMSQFTEPWLTGCTPFDCEILFIYRSSTCSLLLMLFIAQTQTLSEIFHTLCNYKLCTILNTQLTTLFKHLYDICFAKSLDNFYCILMCPNPILISF